MQMLNVAISDLERSKFGISGNVLSFSDFVGIVRKELMKENIEAAVSAADAGGLSAMTMEEITAEVQAVRQDAKNNNRH